jgi:hypothetical protein
VLQEPAAPESPLAARSKAPEPSTPDPQAPEAETTAAGTSGARTPEAEAPDQKSVAPRPKPPALPPEVSEPAVAEQPPGSGDASVDESDIEVKFVDRLGLMKFYYALARVFVVTRDLRPGEVFEAEARLEGTDFLGQAKSAIFGTLSLRMRDHIDNTVKPARDKMKPNEIPGYELMLERSEELAGCFEESLKDIGKKPPERFVVGNQNRPKLSPEEESSMLALDAAFKGLISVRAKSEVGQAA